MSLPVRHLPLVQNWDCHACGQCCKEYTVHVTPEERAKIESQGWAKLPEFAGIPLVVRDGWFSRRWRLNHRPDGSCVFLGDDGYCRIHKQFGGTEKPLACQVYPYVLIPAGDHWRVGVRFACPSASGNKGRPVTAQRTDIAAYALQLEDREGVRDRTIDPPALQGRQHVSWDEIRRFTGALSRILAELGVPMEVKMRRALALAALCRQAKFEDVRGRRLDEFLEMVTPAVAGELPANAELPKPGWVGRILFRMTAALYTRRDTGAKRGVAQRGRLALLFAAVRFAGGQGRVPKVHGLLPDVTFEEMERPQGPLPLESEGLLQRYYQVKLDSYQFFGPIHFSRQFWDGFEALALTLPIILWLSRAFASKSRADAIETALQIVDDNFGYNSLLGTNRQRWITRILAGQGELQKLIAWYAR
ncbi:MAG: YkgJ family cysteine cluster protein [Gemmataceae bacterium]